MSVEKLLNLMRQQGGLMAGGIAQTVLGQVVNYDPDAYSAQVMLYQADPTDPNSQPLQTGWLPIATQAIGVYMAPNVGDLVLVTFQEGSIQNGFITLAVITGTPPVQVQEGHIYISSTNPVNVVAPTINVNATSQVNIGNLNNAVNALLNGLAATVFNNHVHSDPQGGFTGVPTTTMGSSTQTTVLKAN